MEIDEIRQLYSKEGFSDRVVLLFRDFIYSFYKVNERSLPWRSEVSDYGVFISEVMLQQTQAPRVIGKYLSFVKRFPSFEALAQASLREILEEWQGLGYNRRAKMLKDAAEIIVSRHHGRLPRTIKELDDLPGIGYATACSISAFAFNKRVSFIETNVRSVFLYFFFYGKERVSDAELMPLVERAADGDARKWYSALMDYGSFLKKRVNPSRASKNYAKQSKFANSTRQLRGKILRALLEKQQSFDDLSLLLKDERLESVLAGLIQEGLILKRQELYSLE